MESLKVSKTNPVIRRIVDATFPDYKGRKISVRLQDYPLDVRSYWDGGSRSYFTMLRLDTMQTMPIPQQSAFDRKVDGADSVTLPIGVVCVEHVYFCGHDCGLRILVGKETMIDLVEKAQLPGARLQIELKS